MKELLTVHWLLIASLWYFINGLLHDIVVLIQHKDKYNRELLRLLMDGHVLILSGVLVFVAYLMLLKQNNWGATVAIVAASFMILYCFMILPFLKSFGTMGLSVMVIIVSIKFIMHYE